METPLVSVLMPSYNHEKYVSQAILSVVNQTYKNVELIVIDDGSSDNSAEIVKNLQLQYGFTFLIRENKGISKTLNECLRYAKGEFVCLLASDDFIPLNKIEIQVKYFLENRSYGFIHGRNVVVDSNGHEISRSNADISDSSDQIFTKLLKGCFVSGPTVMIRREIINEFNGFDENLIIEDWDLWLKIAHKYEVGFQEDYLAYYRQHSTNNYFSTSNDKILRMYSAEKEILNKWKLDPTYRYVMASHHLRWFYRLSGFSKVKSIPHMIGSLTLIRDHMFYKALLKFILGDTLYAKLKLNIKKVG